MGHALEQPRHEIESLATRATSVAPHRAPCRSSAPTLIEQKKPRLEIVDEPTASHERISAVDDDLVSWAIDFGDRMAVMTTFELWLAIDLREVLPHARVWREGMECWTEIAYVPELSCAIPADADPAVYDQSTPTPEPVSGVRRTGV